MQLQKGPSGILGWFSLKVGGRNPVGFGDTVVPVAEVGDNYLATSELQIATLSSNVTLATFNSRSFTVPNGKVWRLIGASGNYTPNAADVALLGKMSVSITAPNSAPLALIAGVSGNGLSAAVGVVGVSCSAIYRPPIFLPSGWQVAVVLVNSAAWTVAAPFAAELMYQEFDL